MKRQWVVLMGLLSGLGILAGWYWGQGSADAGGVLVQEYIDAKQTVMVVGNVDENNHPIAFVSYDSSLEGLQEYAHSSRLQAETLLKNGASHLYVWVTFRRPLTQAEFATFVTETGLNVQRYTIRLTNSEGLRITIRRNRQCFN